MREQDEAEAWRQIVDNYGERARLDAEPAPDPAAGEPTWRSAEESSEQPGELPEHLRDEPEWSPILDAAEERFVPPTPPPLPRPRGPRALAWLGLFGSPLIFLVCLFAGITLDPLLAYGLVAAFLGGFAYLVWTMPRRRADPYDDGARV